MKNSRSLIRPSRSKLICGLLFLTYAAYGQPAVPDTTTKPVIVRAGVNETTGQLVIQGSNLAPATGKPTVQLDGGALSLVSYNASQIVANFPGSLNAIGGTFLLKVIVSGVAGTFNLAVGATELNLPFSASVNSNSAAIAVSNAAGSAASLGGGLISGVGQPGVTATGGASSTAAVGGPAFAGTGGNGAGSFGNRGGGDGIDITGGSSSAVSSVAGAGVNATGGSVGPQIYGGNGVTAFGGTGEQGGYGISAYGGDAVQGCSNLCTGGAGGVFNGGGRFATNGGDGILAYAGNQGGTGVVGVSCADYSDSPNCQYAALFLGNVDVVGSVSKSGGSFKIDHPLDPANKYLYHSFVESPDMKNIYDGNVITDASGHASVTLPEWFEALNSDFRYQLTVIGQFAHAIVASEISNNTFTIRTDKPNVKVSWQVTGIRQDAWAKAHRIPVEVEKAQVDQGHYLHPELYGHAGEANIGTLHHPRPPQPQQQ